LEKPKLILHNTKNSSAKEGAMEEGVQDWLWLSHPILKILLGVFYLI
jgi:hypothetical protein